MTDGKEFNPLVEWWKIPDKLRKPNPPEQTLYQIGVYLKSISQTELESIYLKIDNAFSWYAMNTRGCVR
jgi:hypothetical protein